MHQHRALQPRQIYASTLTRRERRWLRARSRSPRAVTVVTLATLLAAFAVLAAIAPGLG